MMGRKSRQCRGYDTQWHWSICEGEQRPKDKSRVHGANN